MSRAQRKRTRGDGAYMQSLNVEQVRNKASQTGNNESTLVGEYHVATEQHQLITTNMDLVGYVVRSVAVGMPSHIERDELESAGYVGLIDAAAKYDPSKHIQFRSYAQFRIRGAILDSLRVSDWSPRSLRRKGRMVEQAFEQVAQRSGAPATEAEVATELGMNLVDYQNLLTQLAGLEIGSLQSSHDESEDELSYTPAPDSDEPLFTCLRGELKQHLTDAIASLPERERLIVTLSFFEELTLKEIAVILGIGESRVSQIRTSAVVRLRSSLQAFQPPTRPEQTHRLSSRVA